MDPREFELIAIGHVLARYRATGMLPNINGEPFDLAKFKSHLFAGTEHETDVDVAIIKNTIVNEDDDCEHNNSEPAAAAAPEQPKSDPVEITAQESESNESPEEQQQENPNPLFGGKLFQFFNKDSR